VFEAMMHHVIRFVLLFKRLIAYQLSIPNLLAIVVVLRAKSAQPCITIWSEHHCMPRPYYMYNLSLQCSAVWYYGPYCQLSMWLGKLIMLSVVQL